MINLREVIFSKCSDSTLIRRLQLSLDISAVFAQYPGMGKYSDTSSNGICGSLILKAKKVCSDFEA